MTRTRAFFVIAMLAAGGAGAWFFLQAGAKDGARKPQAAPAVPVRLAKATARDMPLRLEITGRTEAYETVALKSRIEGQVQAVVFTEGQHVRSGDVLLRLDPADFQARLGQAEANLARSQAQLAKARADVERYVALRAKGFVSEEKVAEIRTNASAIESTTKADAAAADLARLQLSYTTIRAPFQGIVGAKLVFPGAAVKINETTLAVINRVRPLYVGFAVPEKYLPQLQAGMRSAAKGLKALVTIPGVGQPLEANVRFLDNGVDVASGTIQLKATLSNDDERLAPGQFVNVSLTLDTLKDAVVVPAEAVQQGADGSFLFVVNADDTVAVRKVRLATVQQRTAAIAEGLAEGESVVTEGQLRLTAGTKVRNADVGDGKGRGGEAKPAPPTGPAPEPAGQQAKPG